MLHEKQRLVLNFLLDSSSPVSSSVLATEVGVSTRTIKTYIQQINRMSSNKIIVSSQNGYTIDRNNITDIISLNTSLLPQNYEERSIYIIKQILIKHKKNINIFDISDDLYVSDSTIRTDISKMNQTYAIYNVSFKIKNDLIILEGSEKAKRKLVSFILFEETRGNLMNITVLKKVFDPKRIDVIEHIVMKITQENGYYINDFALINFILHIAIIIERVLEGNSISHSDPSAHIHSYSDKDLEVNNLMVAQLESEFKIKINEYEKKEILVLFKGTANIVNSTFDELTEIISDETQKLIATVVEKVNSEYFIDLSDDVFMIPFSLHIDKLIHRTKNNKNTKNPMNDAIKNSYPLIHDIAVYITVQLNYLTGLKIPEEEIGFIALHIGTEIDRQEMNLEKIDVIILCPDYGNLRTSLVSNILNEFGNYINLIDVVGVEENLQGINFDLLFTTISINIIGNFEKIVIPPFTSKLNSIEVLEKLEYIKNKKHNSLLKESFENYFSNEIFYINPKVKDEFDVINLIATKMYKLEYVDSNFNNDVIERENAGSTSFQSIAIPHSVNTDAIKTNIGVVIFNDGFVWGNKEIKIVFLIAMSRVDKKQFSQIYEALVAIFSLDENIRKLAKCNNFKDFKMIIDSEVYF